MTEYGTVTPAVSVEASSGVLALRSAVQPDHQARARGVQLLDRATRVLDAGIVLRDWTLENDAAALAWPGAGILASRVRVGAARRLEVDARFLLEGGSATITPLVFTADGSLVVAVLPAQVATAAFREAVIGGAWRSQRLAWDTTGAACIGLHVSGLSAGHGVQLLGGVARPTGAVVINNPLLMRWAPVPATAPNKDQTTPSWAVDA